MELGIFIQTPSERPSDLGRRPGPPYRRRPARHRREWN